MRPLENQRYQEVCVGGVGEVVAWMVCIRIGARVTAGGIFKKLMHSPILETIKTQPLQGIGAEGGRPEAYWKGSWKSPVNGQHSRHLRDGGFWSSNET